MIIIYDHLASIVWPFFTSRPPPQQSSTTHLDAGYFRTSYAIRFAGSGTGGFWGSMLVGCNIVSVQTFVIFPGLTLSVNRSSTFHIRVPKIAGEVAVQTSDLTTPRSAFCRSYKILAASKKCGICMSTKTRRLTSESARPPSAIGDSWCTETFGRL